MLYGICKTTTTIHGTHIRYLDEKTFAPCGDLSGKFPRFVVLQPGVSAIKPEKYEVIAKGFTTPADALAQVKSNGAAPFVRITRDPEIRSLYTVSEILTVSYENEDDIEKFETLKDFRVVSVWLNTTFGGIAQFRGGAWTKLPRDGETVEYDGVTYTYLNSYRRWVSEDGEYMPKEIENLLRSSLADGFKWYVSENADETLSRMREKRAEAAAKAAENREKFKKAAEEAKQQVLNTEAAPEKPEEAPAEEPDKDIEEKSAEAPAEAPAETPAEA